MTQKEAQLLFNTEFVQKLTEETFPGERIPTDFRACKVATFNFCSYAFIQQHFGLTWAEYKALMVKAENYSLFEINLICTAAQTRTPGEVDNLIETGYFGFMDCIDEIRIAYNEIVAPLQAQVQKRIEIMSNAKGAYKEAPVRFIN